jgi:hypothetical protein
MQSLDLVFISYDEPNAEQNFAKLKALCPRAKRVHRVKGFDAAHKAAARLAETELFITVDADNIDVEPAIVNQPIEVPHLSLGSVVAFSAKNRLNGLIYGNGGVKIWPRQLTLEMKSHETADSENAATEFCWTLDWHTDQRIASAIEVTSTPFQAFRAGVREGAKLMTPAGVTAQRVYPDLPLKEAFRRHVWKGNADRLGIWCSIGADVKNGLFAMYGARLSSALLAFDHWDHTVINDFESFRSWWFEDIVPRIGLGVDNGRLLWHEIKREGGRLRRGLDLTLADLDAEGSRFYKLTHAPEAKSGRMMRLDDADRQPWQAAAY